MLIEPAYLKLYKSGELKERVDTFKEMMKCCTMCPRNCKVDRNVKMGYCETGVNAKVSSYNPHFGEEAPLIGIMGSGTIFFTYCNLGCVFCQNYSISQMGENSDTTPEELAEIMISLQEKGCHNINLVSPSHVVASIVEALYIAVEKGLKIPLVYNTGGFDSLETIKLLEGIIDIYMPDIKYGNNDAGYEYSCAKNYWDNARIVVKEMYRQVGDLVILDGKAVKGLIVRHLVLPENVAHSEEIFRFIAEEISIDTYVNIMDQYRPEYKAQEHPMLAKKVSIREYREVVAFAQNYGLHRFD